MTAAAVAGPDGDQRSGYIMEHDGEVARLEAKTDHQATRNQLARAGLMPGMAAVDVGCGSGAVTRIMASGCHAGVAVGVDRSHARLAAARSLARPATFPIEFTVGDVARLPLADEIFDFAWSRFLFEYLPDPVLALAEMIRVTRPGGIVAVADLDGQITAFHPLGPALRQGLDRCLTTLTRTGFDPNVGRKLYSWFRSAGLADIAVDVRPYQVYAGGIPASDYPNWQAKIRTITSLLADSTGERPYWRWFRDAMETELRLPDLFYLSTIVTLTGRRPG